VDSTQEQDLGADSEEQPDRVWLWGLGSTAGELQRKWAALARCGQIARLGRQPIHVSSSEAQPQTTARKGTWFSVNKKPAELSASLRRPLRVRDDLQNEIIVWKKEPQFRNLT
jgi:hypothetical protein